MSDPRWLDWAKELQAMAQTGLTYCRDPWDIERYQRIRAMAAQMLAGGAGLDAQRVLPWFAGESGHATPKLDVRTACFRDDGDGARVLLVRERSDGRWTLPGGWVDVGESAAEAAVRETREEAGCTVRITRLLALYDNRRHPHPPSPWYIHKAIFLGELEDGTGDGGDGRETDARDFFAADALPPLSLGRILPQQLQRLFVLRAGGTTDFD